MKIDKHIEIVRAASASLSSMSRLSCAMIQAVLEQHYQTVHTTIITTLDDLERLVDRQPDLVFLGMKFLPSDPHLGRRDPHKIWLSGYLDAHGLSYTGSGQTAIELECDKPLAKQCVLKAGLATAPFFITNSGEYHPSDELSLPFPLFIKPTNLGGGQGVDGQSVVHNFIEFQTKVRSISTVFRSDSLVEAYLPGREFSVAILEDAYSEELSIMPIELVAESNTQNDRILGQITKSSNAETVLPLTDEAIRHQVSQLAADVFRVLGARQYGRIDIRLDAKARPHFLEANLIPSLIKGYGSFPKACVINKNLDYQAMILKIVSLSLGETTDVDQVVSEFKLMTATF